jgi:hypothetical protein
MYHGIKTIGYHVVEQEDDASATDSNSGIADLEDCPAAYNVDIDVTTSSDDQIHANTKQSEIEAQAASSLMPSTSTSYYQGVKLDLDSITNHFPELQTYDAVKNSRKRTHVFASCVRNV